MPSFVPFSSKSNHKPSLADASANCKREKRKHQQHAIFCYLDFGFWLAPAPVFLQIVMEFGIPGIFELDFRVFCDPNVVGSVRLGRPKVGRTGEVDSALGVRSYVGTPAIHHEFVDHDENAHNCVHILHILSLAK